MGSSVQQEDDGGSSAAGENPSDAAGPAGGLDRAARLACAIFSVPMAVIRAEHEERRVLATSGIAIDAGAWEEALRALPSSPAGATVVEDTSSDPRLQDNRLVADAPYLRFYASVPLRSRGRPFGSLWLLDTAPRSFSDEKRHELVLLAATVADLVGMRLEKTRAEDEQERARYERELLKLTVESVQEGVALVDGAFRLILWNETFRELFDYEPRLLFAGADARELMFLTAQRGELGPGEPREIIARLAEGILSRESGRLQVHRRDGRILDVWRCSIAGGRFIMTARDATQELQAAKLRDELVATVSHELRTPLTAIAGALGLIRSGAAGDLPEQAQRLVELAVRNTDRLRRLVDDLLDLGKLESGQMEMVRVPTDLRRLLEEAVEQNQPYAEQHGVAFVLELPPSALIALVDPGRIVQVLTNLLSNAAKFSPPGAAVQIRLGRKSDAARISVSDEGPGVSPGFRQRLFSRFAQEDGRDDRRVPGTGLGLAICKGIVDEHGGRIELDEAVTRGATFNVYLPLMPETVSSSP